jgi:hypothetical protein
MSRGAQDMKTGPGVLGTAQNDSGTAKHENGTQGPRYRPKQVRERKLDPAPSVLPKTGPGAQNMKIGPGVVGTAQNEYGTAKHKNGTQRTVVNKYGSAKHANGTRRPRYR